MLVLDAGEMFSVGLPDEAQIVSILVVSAMLEVKWLDTNAGTNAQMAVPTPEQLSKVNLSGQLDLFMTTTKS